MHLYEYAANIQIHCFMNTHIFSRIPLTSDIISFLFYTALHWWSKSYSYPQVQWLSVRWWSCWGEGHSSHPCSFHSSSEMCRYPPPAYYIYPHCSPRETPCYTNTHIQESCKNIIADKLGVVGFSFPVIDFGMGYLSPAPGPSISKIRGKKVKVSCGKEMACWMTNDNFYSTSCSDEHQMSNMSSKDRSQTHISLNTKDCETQEVVVIPYLDPFMCSYSLLTLTRTGWLIHSCCGGKGLILWVWP